MKTRFVNSEFIEAYIKEHNMTKTAFCKKCNIGLNTLRLVLTDDRHLTARPLFKIAKAIDVDVWKLLKEKDEN